MKTTILNFGHFRLYILLLHTIFFSVTALSQSVSECGTGTVVTVGAGYTIEFAGYEQDTENCKTFFYYCVRNNNIDPEISHSVFGDFDCSNTCLDELSPNDIGTWSISGGVITRNFASGTPEIGIDGSTGFCGAKFDEGIENNDSRQYFICTDGIHSPGTIEFLIKAGQDVPTVSIPGPVSCSGTCDSECDLAASCSKTDTQCSDINDGTATASPSGGTPPFSYSWSNGGNTQTITGLSSGAYSVTINDANGCEETCMVTINQPTELIANCSSSDVTCNGDSDGTATVIAGGGTPPYSYLWSNGQTTATATGLMAGSFTFTITDANGCDENCTATINEPPVLTAVCSSTDVTCNGGSDGTATATAGGGTPPYSYQWSDGQTTATATGLMAGSFTVTITDANGCDENCTATINEPPVLTAVCSSTDVTCNGGSDGTATATAGGGTPPYSYLWSDGQTTATATSLMAGSFTVTITDANGCDENCTATINEPPVLTAVCSSTDVTCNGGSDGSATVTAGGGTPPNSYLWSDGQTTATATSLMAGSFTVTITDANGCDENCTAIINEPPVLTAVCSSTDVTCNGGSDGSATVTAGGGTPPYSYLWSDGQTTATATSLMAGSFTVTITDANGCDENCTATVDQQELNCSLNCPDPSFISCADLIVVDPNDVTLDCGVITNTVISGPVIVGIPNCIGTTYTYTYTVTYGINGCESTASCDRIFTINSSSIGISCPSDITVKCEKDIPQPSENDVVLTTNCNVQGTITFSGPEIIGQPNCNGTIYIYTYEATSPCFPGTFVTCSRQFIIENDGPVITSVKPTHYIECASDARPRKSDITFTTDCEYEATVKITGPTVIGQTNCPGTINRYTYTVTDDCGRISAPVTRDFIIQNEGPTIKKIYGNHLGCNVEWPELSTTWEGSCGQGGVIKGIPGPVYGSCDQSRVYVFAVTDECGRSAKLEITMRRRYDKIDPVIDAPSDYKLDGCNADWPVLSAPWTDNCEDGGTLDAVVGEVKTSEDGCYQYRDYTFDVKDYCGNYAQTKVTRVSRIYDTTPPSIDTPEDYMLDVCSAPWPNLTASWSDNCSDGGTLVGIGGATTREGCIEYVRYQFTVKDDCNNESTTYTTVSRMVDEENPVIQVPNCDDLDVGVPWPDSIQGTWTDNCSAGGLVHGCPGEVTLGLNGCTENRVYVFEIYDACGNKGRNRLVMIRKTGNCDTGSEDDSTDDSTYDDASTEGSTESTTDEGESGSTTEGSDGPTRTLAKIASMFNNEKGDHITNVEAHLNGDGMTAMHAMSTEDGMAQFEVPMHANYEVSATKEDDHYHNGVSTYDAIILARHILDIEPITNPYDLIAADVNNSGHISTGDILALRKGILSITPRFLNNTAWRFIDASYIFPDPSNPWSEAFPESIAIDDLDHDMVTEFVGVKIGDLNGSATVTNLLGSSSSYGKALSWEVEDRQMVAGQSYDVDFKAKDFNHFGFQFTLELDKDAASINHISVHQLKGFSQNNFGAHMMESGYLTASWNNPYVVSMDVDEVVFSLNITANTSTNLSQLLSINSDYTPVESVDSDLERGDVQLLFSNQSGGKLRLEQNMPNPFDQTTTIQFSIPSDDLVQIRVFDISGKVIHDDQRRYSKGAHSIILNREDIPSSGVLYYEVRTSNDVATKRMVRLE